MTEEKPCKITEKWIDEELASLNRHEIEGAWRSICAMLLWRTANLLTCKFTGDQDFAHQRQSALRWIDRKNIGVVSFGTACEALNMDCEEVRNGLIQHAQTANIWPINNTVPEQSKRRYNHESSGKNSTAVRVVARHQLRARHLVGAAR